MALIELEISLESAFCGIKPEVRAWVDLSPEGGLESEIELPLLRASKHEWSGAFVVSDANDFLYRIGLMAHPGARWSLSLRRRGARRELLTDCDILPLAKSWLVGSCTLSGASRAPAFGA